MRTILIEGDRWFVARDVMTALHCTTKVTELEISIRTNLGEQYVVSYPVKDTIGRRQLTLLLSEKALKYVLQRSRKAAAKDLARELGLELDIMQSPIETETIRVIEAAFSHLNPVDQFFVDGYRIDLYFPTQRVAVECDETHHNKTVNREADEERRLKITNILGCSWVRYAPHEPGFNIGKVINQLIQKLS